MNWFLMVLLTVTLCNSSYGGEKPPWATHTPPDTAKILYFVGRSPKVSSEAEGLRMASKDAKEQLLRQEFGTTIKVDTSQKETLTDVNLDSQLNEISDLILLKGFKQNEVYSEMVGEEQVVWALFSVSRSEIKQEKLRIAELQKPNPIPKAKVTETEVVVIVDS
jgi:hypothetical protein